MPSRTDARFESPPACFLPPRVASAGAGADDDDEAAVAAANMAEKEAAREGSAGGAEVGLNESEFECCRCR